MNEFELNEALEYANHDRAAVDRLEPYLESRRQGLSLQAHRARAAVQRRKNLDFGAVLMVPTRNPLLAIGDEQMLPVTPRTHVQWELTQEGNAWFSLANWPEAGESYVAAIQLAVMNMDLVAAAQNAANLSLACAAGDDPVVGLAWSQHLIEWARQKRHNNCGSILAQALTSGRACLVRMNRWTDTAIDSTWVIDRIGHVATIPFDSASDRSVRAAMARVGDEEEAIVWQRVMRTLAATGSMPASEAGEVFVDG